MTPAGIEQATFRFVAQNLNHCTTVVPHPYIQCHIRCTTESAVKYSNALECGLLLCRALYFLEVYESFGEPLISLKG